MDWVAARLASTAFSSAANQVAVIGGPGLGGLLFAFGTTAVYGACIVFLTLALLLIAATFLTYSNSLSIPLIFDDQNAIVDNQTIRSLTPRNSST